MTILDNNDQDLMQLWQIITELSEQLNQNRSLSVSLYAQAGNVKSQAVHTQSGFVLRRFNLDKSQDEYDTELERMNTVMSAENQSLQYDNKQLNTLIKEYEQTLETVMSNFRNRAKDVQERELSLIREYETRLLALEEDNAARDLSTSTATSEAITRLSTIMRQVLRSLEGEDVEHPSKDQAVASASAHALEREIELARLEKENEELKRMMGLLPLQARMEGYDSKTLFEPGKSRPVGISPGSSVGPFGTFKRNRPVV
ncbi:uncharacterized protein BT62DRAFT_982274 [Guyanagaster necrorhizus]|uniref:Uncharacterized protein n=1 Tax=Guyanagaster necrorhizus TaxID=856835 RepID=A0A9P8APN8_9AGAR|nr:uncharacterized protein BT62DRAFT_982274 [Guyanagaster necrorhizus MCA 3950]KAG7443135.1 hypothetical protein BT62DRAFT_982274 [Guyanagaster necrorhizus MCA 3950]